jgi:uncharacterized membrane protein YebE (DUF533 family)
MTDESHASLTALVGAIIADGKLTRAELKQLDQALLADGQLSAEERQQIAGLLNRIATGELQLVE